MDCVTSFLTVKSSFLFFLNGLKTAFALKYLYLLFNDYFDCEHSVADHWQIMIFLYDCDTWYVSLLNLSYLNHKKTTASNQTSVSWHLIQFHSIAAPGTAPRNLRGKAASATTIALLWDEPEIPNGIIKVSTHFLM